MSNSHQGRARGGYRPYAVLGTPAPAPARPGPRPPCPASSYRPRPQSRALPPVASPMALRATLECDLPRQDHRHLSEGRGQTEDQLTLCELLCFK